MWHAKAVQHPLPVVVVGFSCDPWSSAARYFVAVAEESSHTRAAERLLIRRQSLSQQITLLGRMLGAKLFDRDTRGTSLTAVGVLFLPEARAVLDRADEVIDVVVRAVRGEIGSLRLAFLATTTNYLLPPVVRAVRQRLPGIRLTTEETTIAHLVEGILKGHYDVAFTRPPLVAGLETRTLISEPVCAVLPEDHPLAGRSELRLGELPANSTPSSPSSGFTVVIVRTAQSPDPGGARTPRPVMVTRYRVPVCLMRGAVWGCLPEPGSRGWNAAWG